MLDATSADLHELATEIDQCMSNVRANVQYRVQKSEATSENASIFCIGL